VTDLPISFSAPMIRALIAGTKTQTRRILNQQPYSPQSVVSVDKKSGKWMSCEPSPETGGTHQMDPWRKLKCKPGDRLYVREHWRIGGEFENSAPRVLVPHAMPVFYEADAPHKERWIGRHRQAMHMPKWASRITLIVTDVRVERLGEGQ